MFGRSATQLSSRRVLTLLLLLGALAGLSALHPLTAHASGCENSWTAGKSGSWFTAANWSKKAVPAAGEEVCITENGTYTVEQTQASGTVSVKSITVGGTSGTQTLAVGSSCSVNAVLTTSAGLMIGAQGAVTMTNGDGCGNNVTLAGPVSDGGSLTTAVASGGGRTIEGSLMNTGTLQVNASLAFAGSKTTLTNEGALNVAESHTVAVSHESSVVNGTGGAINGTGNGAVVVAGEKTGFEQGAGKTTGTLPVILEDSSLSYTGSGSGTIAARGATTVTGKSASGQTLELQSTCSKNASISAESFTNGGATVVTNGDGCGNNVTVTVPSGTLTNSGTLTTELAHGGSRSIVGSLTNSGTFDVNTNTGSSGSTSVLKNTGTINIATGVALAYGSSKGVENQGGSITATGSGMLVQSNGGTFTEGGGATSGTQPVVIEDGELKYTGTGASTIALRGSSVLAGSLSAGQNLNVQSTCSKNNSTTIEKSLTNGGAIVMTNGDGCGDSVTLTITSPAVLTNSGTFSSESANGGGRGLAGAITNSGTLNVNATTGLSGSGSLLKNKGTINLANEKGLIVTSGASAENEAGTIAATGSGALGVANGAFNEGAGKTTGTLPVVLEDSALTYSGSGASTIALRGTSTLAGSIAAGQTLLLQSTCSKHDYTTIEKSLTNAGAIVMTNGDGCGNNVTLTVTKPEVLTNSGSISIGHGGARQINGSVTNTGTISVAASAGYGGEGTLLLSGGSLKIAEGVALTVSSPIAVANEGGVISAVGSGQLVMHGGVFKQGNGTSEGTLPVAIEDGELKYTGTGAGTLALRGISTLTGSIAKGQTLQLQSTCGKHANISSGPLGNGGTLVLTNGDGCGNNVTLTIGETGLLTNTGTVKVERAHGGSRTINGSIKNEKALTVLAGATLSLSGTYAQTKKATFTTEISGSGSGSLSAGGTATLEGALAIVQAKGASFSSGQKFAVLSSSALTGKFTKVKGNKIKKSKPPIKFNPVYSGTGVTLEVGP